MFTLSTDSIFSITSSGAEATAQLQDLQRLKGQADNPEFIYGYHLDYRSNGEVWIIKH